MLLNSGACGAVLFYALNFKFYDRLPYNIITFMLLMCTGRVMDPRMLFFVVCTIVKSYETNTVVATLYS